MNLTISQDIANDETVMTLRVTGHDLRAMRPLDDFDKRAMECFNRDGASIEERLMAAQIIVRAVEEGNVAARAQDVVGVECER